VRKTVVSLVLCFFAMRLAVMAGAEDSIKRWVEQLETESDAQEYVAEQIVSSQVDEAKVGDIVVVPVDITAQSGELAQCLGEIPQPEPLVAVFGSDVSIKNDSAREIDLAALGREPLALELNSEGPHVLIIHTHGSEAYTPTAEDMYTESDPYRTEDKTKNVIHVGDMLAKALEAHGLSVIHDREIYDYPSYTGSYSRSGAAVEEYLRTYPSIAIVIDLHRDALGSGDVVYKTRAETKSGECAQVMLLVGTGDNGLEHPHWPENLKLGLYLQNAMEDSYPTLARPLVIKSERYNQHLSTGSLILEVGSTGNTLDEAVRGVELFGDAAGKALAALIKSE